MSLTSYQAAPPCNKGKGVNAAGETVTNWELVFAISSIIYRLGAVCWFFIDPVTPLEDEKDTKAHAHA